ncbi:MAG: four-carbon acid sugar kinase family protein, partial [Acidobacteriota bacterium]
MSIVFGSVADDDTGATDLAGMLADQGLQTVLIIDLPSEAHFSEWTRGHDAVVIGVATRAAAPAAAYERTRAAIRLLATLQPRVVEIKYCSTFDSTPEGNIGQAIEAAMDELGEPFTVALPALPVNGRTTYMGYHFVHKHLLSDSPMRHHPLTPMTNPYLVTHLQSQTRRKVGLAHYPVSRTRLERVREQGAEIAILDCISDADLTNVCAAIADLRLITGSSAPAMKLPRVWRREGWW